MRLLQIVAFVNPFLPYLRSASFTFSYSHFSRASLLFCASSVMCFLSCLHCIRAIGKHCLHLFFFTVDFCMFFISLKFCLMSLLRSLFHWEGFCLFFIMPCVVVADFATVSFTHKIGGVLNFLHFLCY